MMYAADRLLHEMDHLPHRLQGRQVPSYVPPHFELPGERNYEGALYCVAWTHTDSADHGEPHDEPSPYPLKGQKPRQDAAENQRETRRASDARARYPPRPETEMERRSRELRELQEKLRGMK